MGLQKSIMKSIKYTAFILCLVAGACRHTPYFFNHGFWLHNLSDSAIYFSCSKAYPDTSLPNLTYQAGSPFAVPSTLVEPGGSQPIPIPDSLDMYFATIPSDTLQIFIYSARVVQTTPWDTVVARYMVLKRYDLTLDSAQKIAGIVNYR